MAYFPVQSVENYFTDPKNNIKPTRSLRVILRKYAKHAIKSDHHYLFLVHLWDSNFTVMESLTDQLPTHDYKQVTSVVHITPAHATPCHADYSGRLRTAQSFLKVLLGGAYDDFIFSDKAKSKSLPPMGYTMQEVRYISLMFHYNRPDEVALLNFLDKCKDDHNMSVRQVIINALESYRQQHEG